MIVEDDAVINDGLGHAVGRSIGVLSVEDRFIESQDLECLQRSLNLLIGLFLQIGLMVNVVKSKTMTCKPDNIRL